MTGRPRKPLTYKARLPGGQDRLRQMILYVAQKCVGAERFGAVKLNKILWRSDFRSFAARGIPVTGRSYQRLQQGPALVEMPPVHAEMVEAGDIEVIETIFPSGNREKRTVALRSPDLALFSNEDLGFVDESIAHYWNQTATEASDESHGLPWQTRSNGDPMPYELSRLSERRLSGSQETRLRELVNRRGWMSS